MFAGMLGYMPCGVEREHLEEWIVDGLDPCELACLPCVTVEREMEQWRTRWHGDGEPPTRCYRLAREAFEFFGIDAPVGVGASVRGAGSNLTGGDIDGGCDVASSGSDDDGGDSDGGGSGGAQIVCVDGRGGGVDDEHRREDKEQGRRVLHYRAVVGWR